MISDKTFLAVAAELNCKTSRIHAVAEVESGGEGIISGRPVICFEPHIFWAQLVKEGIDPKQYALKAMPVQDLNANVTGSKTMVDPYWADVLYQHWGEKPYPCGQDRRWAQVDKAAQISRDAAMKSASWGKFQIMGFNYRAAGCTSLQEFINRMYKSEDDHLELFCNYIQYVGLVADLRAGNWDRFARAYNGPSYKKNRYAENLAAADLKWQR